LGYVRSALTSDWRGRIGGALARPSLHRLRRRLDYEEVGGVPLLGLNGVVIKAHGSSSARAFQNGIFRASEHVERHVNTLIQDAVGRVVEEESH
jgi:glycerol-3-phosphate acyltransferase PlsX